MMARVSTPTADAPPQRQRRRRVGEGAFLKESALPRPLRGLPLPKELKSARADFTGEQTRVRAQDGSRETVAPGRACGARPSLPVSRATSRTAPTLPTGLRKRPGVARRPRPARALCPVLRTDLRAPRRWRRDLRPRRCALGVRVCDAIASCARGRHERADLQCTQSGGTRPQAGERGGLWVMHGPGAPSVRKWEGATVRNGRERQSTAAYDSTRQ